MSTSSSVILTGLTVAAGTWANGGHIGVRPVLGLGFVALFLATISQADEELAAKFALLILLAAVFIYGPPVVKKIGF
jgi:hypothetical protein